MTPIPIPVHIIQPSISPVPGDMLSPTQYLNYDVGSSKMASSFSSFATWVLVLTIIAVALYLFFQMFKDSICPKCPPCVQKFASKYIPAGFTEKESQNAIISDEKSWD